jgi:hypothetical protein
VGYRAHIGKPVNAGELILLVAGAAGRLASA